MIVTIRTRYSGATDTRGSRITARGAGRSKSVSYNYGARDAHLVAAEALAAVLGLIRVEATGEQTADGRGYIFHASSELEVVAALDVCTDCMMARETGDTGDTVPDREPWNLVPTAQVAPDFDAETGRNFDPFSRSSCGACGTSLAGERYGYAVFSW